MAQVGDLHSQHIFISPQHWTHGAHVSPHMALQSIMAQQLSLGHISPQ